MAADARLAHAQHEAAHVVVGLALGLRLHRATLHPDPADDCEAITIWSDRGAREALLIMYAAGLAWERRAGNLRCASDDILQLRRLRVRGNARVRALELAAWAVLEGRSAEHARITRALLEEDVTAANVAELLAGGSAS